MEPEDGQRTDLLDLWAQHSPQNFVYTSNDNAVSNGPAIGYVSKDSRGSQMEPEDGQRTDSSRLDFLWSQHGLQNFAYTSNDNAVSNGSAIGYVSKDSRGRHPHPSTPIDVPVTSHNRQITSGSTSNKVVPNSINPPNKPLSTINATLEPSNGLGLDMRTPDDYHWEAATPQDPTVETLETLEYLMHTRPPQNLSSQILIPDRANPAHGGLADVHAGVWNTKPVAVKILRIRKSQRVDADWDASNERRVKREICVWAALKHRNICDFLGYTTDFSDYPAMVSMWCHRGTASEHLERQYLSANDRITLALDVSEGLRYLHRHKIIHGDLKPSNVLIDHDCVARLCDFGLVRLADWEGPAGMTTTSPYTGTERYKAPELFFSADNRHPVATFEGDIYSMGCIMLEFVEMLYPFQRFKRNQELRSAIIDRYAPALRSEAKNVLLHMTRDFWDLLEACWGESASRPGIGVVADYLLYFERTLQGTVTSLGQVAPSTPLTMESLMKIYKPVNLTGHIITEGPLAGRNRFVEVYYGFCNHIKVAVKAYRFPKAGGDAVDSLWKTMQQACNVLLTLRHRNISEFLGYSTELQDGSDIALISSWYHSNATEYLRMESLSINNKLRLAQNVADGLLHKHKHKVVHGDLKPTNILVDDDGVARLCDFAQARLVDWHGHADMNTSLPYNGTGRYMAPEFLASIENQLSGIATFEGDIYSLGCIMLNFIEGTIPFQGLVDIDELRNAITNEKPPALKEDSTYVLSNSTPKFWDLLEACWGKPPRRPSIATVVNDLENLARAIGTSS